jgi:outer membrane lipoprotein carrier protein
MLSFFLAWILCMPLSAPPPARESDARAAARALEARYHSAKTLQAVFLERYSEGRAGMQVESGTVYFSRPGRMRWEYESPETKLFLVDGKYVWFYVPADRTASRAPIKESTDWRTPLALLTGKSNLSRLCRSLSLVEPGGDLEFGPQAGSGGDTLLRCLPRGDSGAPGESIREILFEMDASSRLVRVLIREAGDVETEFRFGNWQENVTLPEAKFHFEPPAGVAIVNEADLTGAIH